MWIRRRDYDEMLGRALEAKGAVEALERQVATQKTHIEWMAHRLTQLEHERAQLIYRYMDVKISVPTIELDTPATPETSSSMSDLPSFNDVGDEEAKKLGLDWDEDGRVTQHGKAIA